MIDELGILVVQMLNWTGLGCTWRWGIGDKYKEHFHGLSMSTSRNFHPREQNCQLRHNHWNYSRPGAAVRQDPESKCLMTWGTDVRAAVDSDGKTKGSQPLFLALRTSLWTNEQILHSFFHSFIHSRSISSVAATLGAVLDARKILDKWIHMCFLLSQNL